jgi:hypothetical protein
VQWELIKRWDAPPSQWNEPGQLIKRWEAPLRGIFAGLAVLARNCRTPGMRIVGIRRVDVGTHGPVGVDSAIVGVAVSRAIAQSHAVNRPVWERYEARRVAADEEIERISGSRSAADAAELLEASRDVQRAHQVGCGWLAARLLAQAAATHLPVIPSARRQTLYERLAGTLVIDDR